jgi:hypothetical protein
MVAEQSQGKRSSRRVRGVFDFVGLEGQQAPAVRLEAVSPTGERKPIDVGKGGEFNLSETDRGKGYRVEVVNEQGESVRRFAYDTLVEQLRDNERLHIPIDDIIVRFTCVGGSVEVCRYILDPVLPFASAKLEIAQHLAATTKQIELSDVVARWPYPWPGEFCRPVCQGRVEVYLQICCCPLIIDPPVIIKNLCEIIDCHEIFKPSFPPEGPWGPLGPLGPHGPGPGPGPLHMSAGGGDPTPGLERATVRALKRAETQEDGPSAADVLVASAHLTTLAKMQYSEQVEYIRSRPDLLHWWCTCSTSKVADVPLQADGHFDACWAMPRLRAGCSARVIYKVTQATEAGWQVIYDGFAVHQSFGLADDAVLHARWNAIACDDPHDYGPTPFVLLEQIGDTWADALIHSTDQTGETAWGALATKDGLVNAKPLGAGITDGPYDQPWATTLALRFQFHPGLEALGARFYRVRVVPVDNGTGGPFGSPVPSEFTLTDTVSWRKYNYDPVSGVGTHWETLNDTVSGFYRIPFPDPMWPWLGGQYHAYVDTQAMLSGVARMPNGRYLFVVDIFDASHKRLVPNGTVDALVTGDTKKGFDHRRLTGPIDAPFTHTAVVPHNALGSLFRVDNLPCYGDIEAIVKNGSASMANCQFLTGPGATTNLQLQYSARQDDGFQWFHQIYYKQGLTGPVTYLPANNANVSSGLSPSKTFNELLGGETKCAFAANLTVLCRHTNGSGRISGFDRYDVAAFALEQT